MNRGLQLGPHSLDAALLITKHLQRDLRAELTAVDSDPGATTIHLSVPRVAVRGLLRKRRERWASHVDESVRRRKAYTSGVELRVSRQRAHLGESRSLAAAVEGVLNDRAEAAQPT